MIQGSSPRARLALVLLSAISLLNYVDRQIFTILLEPVKHDLQVSDMAMGFLSGTTFAVFYAAASLPIARWADSGVRRSILAGAVAIWSTLTSACALAQSFQYLAIMRAGVAVAESAAVPISHSLVADLFPQQKRASIFGVLMAAGAIGIGLGLFVGGWTNTHFGWRAAFAVVGMPGVLLALVLRFTIKEPARTSDVIAPGSSEGFLGLIAHPLYRSIMILAAIGSIITYGLLGWAPTFMIRVHGLTTAQVGLSMGFATALGSVCGHYGSARLADHLAARDVRWYAWIPAIGNLLSVPFAIVFLTAPSVRLTLIAFTVELVFMNTWLMPIYALAFRLASSRSRARASAVIAAVMSLVGLGLGPLAVGALNDRLAPSLHSGAIRVSLIVLTSCSLLLAIGFMLIVSRVRLLGSVAFEAIDTTEATRGAAPAVNA